MSANPQVSQPEDCDGVDQRLPAGRLATLGLQHVMVMYAGAVAVPLIIGEALGLTKDQIALLINAVATVAADHSAPAAVSKSL